MTHSLGMLAGDAVTILEALERDVRFQTVTSPMIGLRLAYEITQLRVKSRLEALVDGPLRDALFTHTVAAGQRTAENADTWDNALDSEVEFIFDQFSDILSASWLGEKIIDARLHEPDAIERLTQAFVNEAWRNLTHTTPTAHLKGVKGSKIREMLDSGALSSEDLTPVQLTPNKVMSVLGVTRTEIAELIEDAGRMPVEGDDFVAMTTPKKEEPKIMRTMEQVKARLHNALPLCAVADSVSHYTADLENASDDDDILSQGAITRLGGDMDDVYALRQYRAEQNFDSVEDFKALYEEIKAHNGVEPPMADTDDPYAAFMGDSAPPAATKRPPPPPPPPPPPGAPAASPRPAPPPPPPPPPVAPAATDATDATPPTKGRKSKEPAPPQPGQIPGRALVLLKEGTGRKSEDLAEAIGTSRATFENYAKDKGVLISTEQHRINLHKLIDIHIEKLTEARKLIDSNV